MTALPIQRHTAPSVTPVDLPRLRPVSTRQPIDVPVLHAPVTAPSAPAPLRAVREPHEETVTPTMRRVLDVATIGLTIASASAFAVTLQYWLAL